MPVGVQPSHLLMSGLMAFILTRSFGTPGAWPATVLLNPGHPAYTATLAALTVLWMVLISLSVFVHELGHALTARRFGYPVSMEFIGIGGRTRVEGADRMAWHQDVLFTLAGPAAGLTLSVLAGLLTFAWDRLGHQPQAARYALENLFYANLWWTLLNLAPLATLDGGRFTATLFTRLFGRGGFLGAQVLSLGLSGAIAAFAVQQHIWLLLALVLMLGTRTFANIAAYNRGELPVGDGAHPLLKTMARAETTFKEAHFADAEALTREVLAQNPPPVVKSRAHLLLGWVSLKAGQGRAALDHFSQVQGVDVPAQALAAAFSLIGADDRALPLWAAAAQTAPSPVVLHEFAAALIRLGREPDARRLPGVRPALAFSAAERVHYVRGEYEQAAHMAEAAFREEPSPGLAYDAACAWARARDVPAALRMLTLASQNGFSRAQTARTDPDLQSQRQVPQFEAWLASLEPAPVS